jgi:hypothetical protein
MVVRKRHIVPACRAYYGITIGQRIIAAGAQRWKQQVDKTFKHAIKIVTLSLFTVLQLIFFNSCKGEDIRSNIKTKAAV